MIHFFAGAHKNGSHFQFYVLEEALRQRAIPYRVVGLQEFHSHDLERARKLLADWLGSDETLLLKGHWHRPRERQLLRHRDAIKVYLIWRDLKDVLISSYHYRINKFGAEDNGFPHFYFEEGGRDLLINQRLYRIAWSGEAVHETSYESLVDDFQTEARRLLAYAGVKGVDLGALKAETSIGRLRETRDDQKAVFFRNGATGQHRVFDFGEDVALDMEKLINLGHPALLREQALEKAKRGLKKIVRSIGIQRSSAERNSR